MVIHRNSKCLLDRDIRSRFHLQDFKFKVKVLKVVVRGLVSSTNHLFSHHMDNSRTRTTSQAQKHLKRSRYDHRVVICRWTILLVDLDLPAPIALSNVPPTTSQHLAHLKFDSRSPELRADRTTKLVGRRPRSLWNLYSRDSSILQLRSDRNRRRGWRRQPQQTFDRRMLKDFPRVDALLSNDLLSLHNQHRKATLRRMQHMQISLLALHI